MTKVAYGHPSLVTRGRWKAIRFPRSFLRTSSDSEDSDFKDLSVSPEQDFPQRVSINQQRRYDMLTGFDKQIYHIVMGSGRSE